MGYELINGKRCYRHSDGSVTVDNVSAEEAERRARNETAASFTGYTQGVDGFRERPTRRIGAAGGGRALRWLLVVLTSVALITGAVLYNQGHISNLERSIIAYMQDGGDDVYTEDYPCGIRYLAASELEGRSRDEIQLMINEIYARHGRVFSSGCFDGQEWYVPVQGKTDEEIVQEFNCFEESNIALLTGINSTKEG